MRNGTQIFQCMTFFLKRIIRAGDAVERDTGGMQLEGLARIGSQHDAARHRHGRADAQLRYFSVVLELRFLEDYL